MYVYIYIYIYMRELHFMGTRISVIRVTTFPLVVAHIGPKHVEDSNM